QSARRWSGCCRRSIGMVRPLTDCRSLFCSFCVAYREPESARIQCLLSFGFLVQRTKPLKIKKIQGRSLGSFIQQSRPLVEQKDLNLCYKKSINFELFPKVDPLTI